MQAVLATLRAAYRA